MTAAATTTAHVVHVPEPLHLREELERLVTAPRAEAVAGLKALRAREAAALAEHQRSHLGEITGADVCLQLTGLTDAVLRILGRRAALRVGAGEHWQDRVGLFAVGGYGRGDMNPASDLDLLVVVATPAPPWASAFYGELQALCWDVKFTVGASQRHLGELDKLISTDFVTATALIEQRPLMAGLELTFEVSQVLERFRTSHSVSFLRYKIEELTKRRTQAGVSVFLMEPNLKSNPGCLRDVQLLRNIAFIVYGSRNLLSLAELEAITRQDLNGVVAANDHLLALRSLLHFHHGRKQDVFQLPDQVRLAALYGYADVSRLRAVEHFMKHHYAQVRHVHQIVDLTISRLEALGHLGPRTILVRTRRQITEEAVAFADQVYLTERDFWKRPDAAARIMALARAAQKSGARLSFELQRELRANIHRVDDHLRHDSAVAALFLEMLGDSGRIRPILTDLHECGWLGAYLPEFGNLTCLMQFDSYHQYTVDEHTLIGIGHLDALAQGKATGLPGMSRIFPRIARKDLLALSLLLHDMGKYMGRGHVARGAIMVAGVAERLGLSPDEEDFVYFLVERHVSLSDASRMRNFQEPQFLRAFAEKMVSRDNLDALYCLTWCDAKAVGDGILTGWQESILGELRDALDQQLGGQASGISGRRARIMGELSSACVPMDAALAHLEYLPGAYVHQIQPGEAARHFQVVEQVRTVGIGLHYDIRDKFIHLTAAAPDRHELMADICATLSGHGFDIIDLRTWTTVGERPVALYSMRLSTIYAGRVREEETWAKLRKDLLAVSARGMDPRVLLARRRGVHQERPADSGFDDPAVKVEQRTSDAATIVDVHTKDEVGLLSTLCRTISDHGCEIRYACISTMGDVAVDVFYVNRQGQKLTDEDAEGLRTRLIGNLHLVKTTP